MPATDNARMQQAMNLVADKQLELSSKGYSQALIDAAISRARGMAHHKVQPLSPEIQEQGFMDFLADELRHAENWIDGWVKGMER